MNNDQNHSFGTALRVLVLVATVLKYYEVDELYEEDISASYLVTPHGQRLPLIEFPLLLWADFSI